MEIDQLALKAPVDREARIGGGEKFELARFEPEEDSLRLMCFYISLGPAVRTTANRGQRKPDKPVCFYA